MTGLDGKRQRNALTAAERSLRALGSGNGERAIRSAAKASDLDQLGLFGELPRAVEGAAEELAREGAVGAGSWDGLEAAVGPGPLRFLIQELRS